MSIIEFHTIKLVRGIHEVTYAPDGKYIVIMKENKLKVSEFEREFAGQVETFILRDQFVSTHFNHKIVCFPNYLVYVMISDINERCLSLLRWDFRKESTLRLELPFPDHINWKNKSQYFNLYEALPADIAQIFQTDFVPFNDKWVSQFFQVDYLVLEQSPFDFQLIGFKGEKMNTLLPYKEQTPSPFTMPYLDQIKKQHGIGRITIDRYKEGTIRRFQLLFQRNGIDFHYLNESIYLILGIYEIKIFVKSKMVRKFTMCGLELLEHQQNYLFSSQIGSGNTWSTQRFDIRNAKTLDIAKKQNAILRGNYIFQKVEQTNYEVLMFLLMQGIPLYQEDYIVHLQVLKLE